MTGFRDSLWLLPWAAFGACFVRVGYRAYQTGWRMLASAPYREEIWPVRAAMVSGIVVSLIVIGALIAAAASAVSSWY